MYSKICKEDAHSNYFLGESVFNLILNTAIKNKISQEEMIDK